jgi:hypothetical protein
MFLKPQDVLVLMKLSLHKGEGRSYASLASELGMSASEVHAAVRRSREAGLLAHDELRPLAEPFLELLTHGLKYVLPARRGPVTRGLPTAHAAPPLRSRFMASDDLPPVWPDPEGTVRGESYEPIYPSAVVAAKRDSKLYEALALVDALRGGKARERKAAEECLRKLVH